MKVIIFLIFVLALIGVIACIYMWATGGWSGNATNDDRPRWVRKNHAEMARQLEQLLMSHDMGSLFLPPGSREQVEEIVNKYNKHIL